MMNYLRKMWEYYNLKGKRLDRCILQERGEMGGKANKISYVY